MIIKKILFVIICVSSAALNLTSQNLGSPSDAELIFTIRGGEIFDKMSIQEMESMPYLGDFFNQLIRMSGSDASSVSELGIDLNSTAEYFIDIENEKDVVMMGMSFKVSDAAVYKSNFLQHGTIENAGGIDFIMQDGMTSAMAGDRALITYAIEMPSNDYDPYSYDEYMYDEAVEVEAYPYDEVEEVEEWVEEEVEEVEEVEEAIDEVYEIEEEIVDYNYEEEQRNYEEMMQKQMEEMEKQRMIEMEQMRLVSQDYVMSLFKKSGSSSVSTAKMVDQKADFSIVISEYGNSIQAIQKMNSSPYNRDPFGMAQIQEALNSVYDGIEFVTGNGYFEKDAIKIEFKSKFSDEYSDITKSLSGDFNTDMLRYIPFDSEIGHISFALNTENTIHSYYNMASQVAKGLDQEEAQAIELGVEMAKLFIDEKAIGNLFKGDAYFGVTDLNSYEVEYTSYEYDDNWNYTEVTKTKQEIRPDFLCMFSSEEYGIVEKVFNLISLETRGEFKKVGDYYMMPSSSMVPLDIYCMHKDGIVFIFTSQSHFDFIMKGGSKPNSSKSSEITDNFLSMTFDAQSLFSKIPLEDMNQQEQEMVKMARENLGKFSIQQGRVKDNIQTSTVKMETLGDYSNSVEYLLNMFNEMGRIENDMRSQRN